MRKSRASDHSFMIRSSRRSFIKSGATLAGAALAPNLLFGQQKKPAELQVAAIGCNGKGLSDITEIAGGNRIAFLCDVDANYAGEARTRFPEAKFFQDYREMFAEVADKIDVVTVSTPDHMHFPIALEAIRRGKPIMLQKPLCNSLWETRALSNFAKQKGVLTVMGNQGATFTGTRLLREWIEGGLIGEVTDVHYWTNRPAGLWAQGPGLQFPAEPVPSHLRWDLWQGSVATERAYNSKIHPFGWRGFWDYGCGALGDIGCHAFNGAFWALDLRGDFVVEPVELSEADETIAPLRSKVLYHFPAKGGRAALKIHWQDGIADPNKDPAFVRPPGIPADLKLNEDCGQVYVGTEGVIYIADMYGRGAPMLFDDKLKEKSRTIRKSYERIAGGPTQELCRAIRGEGEKPVSNFIDHAGPLTEIILAGNLAVRMRRKIDWDSAGMEVRGVPEARALMKRNYRAGWEPNLG